MLKNPIIYPTVSHSQPLQGLIASVALQKLPQRGPYGELADNLDWFEDEDEAWDEWEDG